MIFRETGIGGVLGRRARAARGRARLLRPDLGRRRSSRSSGLNARLVQCSISFNRAPRHAPRAPLPGSPRTRRRSSSAARPARSSTSPSTCGRTRRPSEAGSASSSRRRTGCALYVPEGCAHGFLTLDGRLRGRLPDLRALRARGRARRSLGRSGVRDRLAGRGRRDQRARPVVPGLRPAEASCVTSPSLPSATGAGERMHALARELFPICRSITGDGVRETLAAVARADPARAARGAERHAGARLDGARRVEHPRRLHRAPDGRPGRRLPRVEPPRRELQRAGAGGRCRSTSSGRTCTRSPEHPDWIPYRTSYYSADLGVLPLAAAARRARRRRRTRS